MSCRRRSPLFNARDQLAQSRRPGRHGPRGDLQGAGRRVEPPGGERGMKLYGAPMPAPNPRRVRIFLAEKGITLTKRRSICASASTSRPSTGPATAGPGPALELDDGRTISETVSICRYFEALHPEPALFGRDAFEIATVDQWIRRAEFILMQPVGNFWRHAHPCTSALLTQFNDFGESNREAYAGAQQWLDRELAGRDVPRRRGALDGRYLRAHDRRFRDWIGLPIDRRTANSAGLVRPRLAPGPAPRPSSAVSRPPDTARSARPRPWRDCRPGKAIPSSTRP